jgi:hypothetical protein
MAMKIMRFRVRDSLTIVFKHVGKDTNITREQIQPEEYINHCKESNLAFLRCIPNSTWYWAEKKRDLFAMIRQLGKPTVFLTKSANEIGWPLLLQILYKLKNNGIEISKEATEQLHFIEKSTLINEDARYFCLKVSTMPRSPLLTYHVNFSQEIVCQNILSCMSNCR